MIIFKILIYEMNLIFFQDWTNKLRNIKGLIDDSCILPLAVIVISTDTLLQLIMLQLLSSYQYSWPAFRRPDS